MEGTIHVWTFYELYRVNGVLGVSRSFGDIMYKNFAPEENHSPSNIEGDLANVWQKNYQVTSLPDV